MAENTTRTITIKINGEDALVDLNEIKKALKETGAETKKLKETNLGNFSSNLKDLKDQFIAGEIGAKGLAKGVLGVGKAMITAFITNPVGIAIAAIGAAVLVLYNVFKDFKPLVDKIEQSFAALGAVWTTLKSSIMSFVSGNKSLSASFDNLGKSMKDAAKEAAILKKAEQDLEDSAAALEVQNAKTNTQIQQLILQSKSRTITEKERQDLITQAMDLESKQNDANVKYADEAERIALNKLTLGKNLSIDELKNLKEKGIAYARELQNTKNITDEEIEAWKKTLVAKEGIAQGSIAIQEKAQNRLDASIQSAQDKAKAASEKAIADAEKNQALIDKMFDDSFAQNDKERQSLIASEDLKNQFANNEFERKRKLKEFEDNTIDAIQGRMAWEQSAEDVRKKFEKARQKFADIEKETHPKRIAEQNAWREKLIEFDTFETLLAKDKLGREDAISTKVYENNKKNLEAERDNLLLSYQERLIAEDKLKTLENDRLIQKKDSNERFNQIERDNLAENLKNQIIDNEKAINNADATYAEKLFIAKKHLKLLGEYDKDYVKTKDDLEQEAKLKSVMSEQEIFEKVKEYKLLKRQLKADEFREGLDQAAKSINDIAAIDQAATETAINRQKNLLKDKLITQEQYDKNVADIQKKAAKREKAYAVSSVIISTIQGVSNALATKLPWPVPIVMAGIAAALGAVQIAKIVSTPIESTTGSVGGVGLGGASASSSSSTSSSSTGTSPNTSFTFEKNTQAVANNPIKTYVVSKEVTTQAQLDRQVIANGSI